MTETGEPSRDYETGYRDGESSGYADWVMSLSEYLDIEAEGPTEAIAKINDRIEAIRAVTMEECAKVADKIARTYCDENDDSDTAARVAAEWVASDIRSLASSGNKREG